MVTIRTGAVSKMLALAFALSSGVACQTPGVSTVAATAPKITEVAPSVSVVSWELVLRNARNTDPRGVVFYLQGSSASSALRHAPRLAGLLMLGFRVIVQEKRGVSADGTVDENVLRENATRDVRIHDHCEVIRGYLAGVPESQKVVLIGGSEGGDIAAAVAARVPRVTHLVLLGAGGGWTQARELRCLMRKHGEVCGLRDPSELDLQLSRIRTDEDDGKTWAGHTYRRWKSYLWKPAVDELLPLAIPVLSIHGKEDRSVPVESARAMKEIFAAAKKENLTLVELDGLDHAFHDAAAKASGFPLVEIAVIDWFGDHGVLELAAAEQAKKRVRAMHPEVFATRPRPEEREGDGR